MIDEFLPDRDQISLFHIGQTLGVVREQIEMLTGHLTIREGGLEPRQIRAHLLRNRRSAEAGTIDLLTPTTIVGAGCAER